MTTTLSALRSLHEATMEEDEEAIAFKHLRLRLAMPGLPSGGKWAATGTVGWSRLYKKTVSFGKGATKVAMDLPGAFEGMVALLDHANIHKGTLHFQMLNHIQPGHRGFDGSLQWQAQAVNGREIHLHVLPRQSQVRLYFTANTALKAKLLRFEDSTPWREEKKLTDGKLSCVLPPNFTGTVHLMAADDKTLATWRVHALGTPAARLDSVQAPGVRLAHANKGTRVAEWHVDVSAAQPA